MNKNEFYVGDKVWFELGVKPHSYTTNPSFGTFTKKQPRFSLDSDTGSSGIWVCGEVADKINSPNNTCYLVVSEYGGHTSHGTGWWFDGMGAQELRSENPIAPQITAKNECVCPREVWLNGCKCGAIAPYVLRLNK